MAIEKKTIYHIQCEGPLCEQEQRRTVDKVPNLWSRLKITDVTQVLGHPPQYLVTTLCFNCTAKAIIALKNAGFKLTTVKPSANEQKKEGEIV